MFKLCPPALLLVIVAVAPVLAQDEPPLPQPRPEELAQSGQEDQPTDEEAAQESPEDVEAPDEEPEQEPEPERIYQAACPALLTGRVIGEMVPPLAEGACGLQSPIAVAALVINGREIPLSGTPVTNCAMATTLADWAEEVDAYAGAALDTHIESLSTGPGYQCRLRNGAETGFVSEHGLGNAVDITAISFADGTSLSVLEDWDSRSVGAGSKFLGFAHSAACGRFTTVLGPEANADHEDHFHFDLGCHGQTCTAQICE
ncbi:extensin family protein [Pelagibacterium sp. H642]|uniref:extensin-like domain-containing protein n=1 Tax=Pelagibacterium sp. H642 TaxID=1881069 RepID=UPI002815D58E|nr:extensin family protein [Pelagibacterium sp. H642]WMT92110.1 extensin family protein [Pelagibacterium sp. H642]